MDILVFPGEFLRVIDFIALCVFLRTGDFESRIEKFPERVFQFLLAFLLKTSNTVAMALTFLWETASLLFS